MELPRRGLVTYTWGNVSGIDREKGLVVIKPSGVSYEDLTPGKLVVISLDGKVVEGNLNPSSDTKTIWCSTRRFPSWAASCTPTRPRGSLCPRRGATCPPSAPPTPINFYGPVPCTRELTPGEIDEDYEKNTGKVIIETFQNRGIDPVHVRCSLCQPRSLYLGQRRGTGCLHAVVLEEVAKMAILTLTIDPDAQPAPQHVLDKHFMRKHGPNAYYGQK